MSEERILRGNAHDREDRDPFVELKTEIIATRAELSGHVQLDALQFQHIGEKLKELSTALTRISWAGWPIAAGVIALLAKAFLPAALH